MILTLNQIEKILKEIDKNILVYIGMNLGEEVLTSIDRDLIRSYNINFDLFSDEHPYYYRMFLLGRLTQLIGDYNSQQLDYVDFDQYLKKKQYHPLTSFEKIQYELARQNTYSHLKNLGGQIRIDTENSITSHLSRSEYEKIIKEKIEEGVLQRKTVSGIISDIGHKTDDWKKDLGRIVDTEMNNIFQKGRAIEVMTLSGKKDPLVYKDVYEGACRHCIHLYLTRGLGSEPRVFRLSELIANGSNIGRKVENWRASIQSTHPFCFINSKTRIYTDSGWVAISEIQVGNMVLTHMGRFRKVTSLIRHKFQNEEIFNVKVNVRGHLISLTGITGSHPVLTNRGWVRVDQLQVVDRVSFGILKCSECLEDFPIYYCDDSSVEKSLNVCSLSCNSKHNNEVRRVKLKDPEYKLEDSKKRSKILKQLFKDRPELIEKSIETKRVRYLNMTFEERCNLTKNANKRVRELIESGEFNPSEKFLNPKRGKKSNTSLECKMKWLLEKLNIEFIEQFEILRNEIVVGIKRRRYYVDFYLPKYNLVIECDGYYHNTEEQKVKDLERDLNIKKLIGAEVVHFSDTEILQDLGGCFKKVNRVLANHEGQYSEECSGEIVSIERRSGSQLNGYFRANKERLLYNFSVEEDESYIANGFAVHNCRCTLRYLEEYMKWDKEKKKFVDDEEKLKREEERLGIKAKIKITVGTKEFIV